MVPFGISLHQDIWHTIFVIDGAKYGGPISGMWKVGTVSKNRLKCFDEGGDRFHVIGTIGGRYMQCGIRPVGDARGIVDTVEIPNSAGLEVWIRDDHGNRRLSVNSCMRVLSLRDVRNQRWNWPLCLDNQDHARELSCGEKCTVLGNAKWWMGAEGSEPFGTDILWRPTPLTVRQAIIDEVFDTSSIGEALGPFDNFQIGADQFNFGAEYENGDGLIGRIHEDGVFWPRFQYFYAPYQNGGTSPSLADSSGNYRAGTKGEPSLPLSRSGNPQWGNHAMQRRRHSLETYGYPPFVKWETLSDRDDSLYEREVTGNTRLPPRRSFWGRMKDIISSWWTHLCGPKANSECTPLDLESVGGGRICGY